MISTGASKVGVLIGEKGINAGIKDVFLIEVDIDIMEE